MKKFLILSALMAAAIGPAFAGGVSSRGESSAMSSGPSASKPGAASISVATNPSHGSGSAMSQSDACPPTNVKTGRGQCELPPALSGVTKPVYLDYQSGKTFWGKRKVDGIISSQTPIPLISFQTNALHISCTKFACDESAEATTPMPFRAGMKTRAIDFTAHCLQGPDDTVAHCKVAISEHGNSWQ